jgi:NADH-quinone oxidoreductase subunit M
MFALTPVGLTGSIVQQVNHGISTGALFLIVGIVYERRHTREIAEYGGLSKVMPLYAAVFGIMTMSSIGLPTLNGFIGEVLILVGVFVKSKIWAAVAASGIVLGAAYMLWLFQRTMFGKVDNPKNQGLKDLSVRELVTFAPLIIIAFWIGLYPKPFIDRLDTSVAHVMARVSPEYGERNALFAPCPTTEQLQAMARKMTEATPVSTTGGQPSFVLPPCEPGKTEAKPAPIKK